MFEPRFWIDSDNLVKVPGLHNALTGSYINDGSAVGVLTDAAGTVLSTFNLTYVAESNGDYAGEIPSTVTMTEGAEYTLTVTVTGGGFQLVLRAIRLAAYFPGTN